MRIITLVFYVFLVTSNSCVEEPFDAINGQRSFVTGSVVDIEGNPVEDYDLKMSSFGSIVGTATTNKNGSFEAVILDDANGTRNMVVEPFFNDGAQSSFRLTYNYNETQFSRTYNTVPITVSQQVRVTVNLDIISMGDIEASISYTRAYCYITFQNDILESSNCFDVDKRTLFSFQQNTFIVPLNTEFKITVQANGETTEYTYLIDENDYEIQLSI